jgi:hypothetical protein
MIDKEHYNGSNDCDDHTVNVEAGYARSSEPFKNETTYESSDDPQCNVEPEALALPINNFAGEKSCDQAQDNPTDDRHWKFLNFVINYPTFIRVAKTQAAPKGRPVFVRLFPSLSHGVFHVACGVVNCALGFVDITFSLQLPVAGDLASGLFDSALNLVSSALHVVAIHY